MTDPGSCFYSAPEVGHILTERLVLFAHGSHDPRWRHPFEQLSTRLERILGPSAVTLAFMQMATPSLADVVDEAARDGVSSVKVFPLSLSAGAHVERDIPAQVRDAQTAHPAVDVRLLPAAGTDPRVANLLTTLALEAAGSRPNGLPDVERRREAEYP